MQSLFDLLAEGEEYNLIDLENCVNANTVSNFLHNTLHCLPSLAPFSAFIMTKYTAKYYTNDQNEKKY